MASSSLGFFGRQRSLHQILGGGIVADVMLWRRRDATIGILLGALTAWVVFHVSGYTLASLVSNVVLVLISIFFVWAKAAGVLNRPPPPIPEVHFSEEAINEAAVFVCSHVNMVLLGFHDIALGKDSRLFYKVAACLWLTSIVGSWADFLTLCYAGLVIVVTAPALYEKYEDIIDRYLMLTYVQLQLYERIYAKWYKAANEWVLEKLKQC